MNEDSGEGEGLRSLVSKNIRRFRLGAGLSQEELAERADISAPYMGALERGEKWPGPGTFAGLARGLGVEPHDLMRPEDASSREVRQIIGKLVGDINALVNSSLNAIGASAAPEREGGK